MDEAAARPTLQRLLVQARKLPFLGVQEERELALRNRQGDHAAGHLLVLSHMALVVRHARVYARFGVPLADLIHEGLLGLMTALKKFEPEREIRFAAYASHWIRAALQEHVVRMVSMVRPALSTPHRSLFLQLKARAAAFKQDIDDMTEDMAAGLAAKFNMTIADVRAVAQRLTHKDKSLDETLSEGDAARAAFVLADPGPSPEERAAAASEDRVRLTALDTALASIPAREAVIVRLRHLAEHPPSFEAIGRQLGISKDRVRQLEQRALVRLREVLAPQREALGIA